MNRIAHTRFVQLVTLLLLLLLGGSTTLAQTTSFTYQGRLTDGGGPATGAYDLQFKLFDALTGGAQVGATSTLDDVAVSTGSFTVTLDFGAAAFPGASRWLEIGVRPGVSTGAYTTLTPRQPITPTPYAMQSLNAATATTASNATTAVNFSGSLAGNVTGTQSATVLANNAVTGAKIATGQVVKSLNGLFDIVTLAAGSNITLTPSGNTLTIAATGAANNWSLTGNFGSTPSLNFLGTNDNQPLAFRINGAEVMRLNAGGGVGIGTASPPLARLHVEGTSNATAQVLVRGTAGVDPSIELGSTESGSSVLEGLDIKYINSIGESVFNNIYTPSTNAFRFQSGATDRVVIQSAGNVGIGATPLYKLHVAAVGNHALYAKSDFIGVWGDSSTSTGVYGSSTFSGTGITYGVQGLSLSSVGAGVYGRSDRSHGVEGFSTNGTGVAGFNSSSFGAVFGGNSGSGPGVYGQTASTTFNQAGVFGEATATSGFVVGVYGRANNDPNGTGVAGFGRAVGGYFQATAPGGISLVAAGTAQVNVLQIMGGSDLAEHFAVVEGAKPGLVVAIDPDHPGQLSIARRAYNRRVAGVISGANKLDAGMVLSDLPGSKNSLPVALSGRVWVYCDATRSAIQPGDLLTTSNIPGHAMKVTNHAKAQGATIGKAMTSLKTGRGLVLVLVTLQ